MIALLLAAALALPATGMPTANPLWASAEPQCVTGDISGPCPVKPPRPFGRGAFGRTYVNSAGHVVRRPILADEKPFAATGRCMDRYWTFAERRVGACQGHGGVWVWLSQ